FGGEVTRNRHGVLSVGSGLAGQLGSSLRVLGVESGGGHDGASQIFGGNGVSSACRRAAGFFYGGGRDEAIAPSNYGLQILRLAGVVGQGTANLADSCIDPLFNIDEHIFAPQRGRDFFACDQLPPLFDEEHEQLQGQALEPNRGATAAELKTAVIQLEIVEANFLLRQCTTPRLPNGGSTAASTGGRVALGLDGRGRPSLHDLTTLNPL